MVLTQVQALVLSIANGAYHAGRGRLIEPLPRGRRGDSLADFLASELRVVSNRPRGYEGMIAAIERLDDVINELITMRFEMESVVKRVN